MGSFERESQFEQETIRTKRLAIRSGGAALAHFPAVRFSRTAALPWRAEGVSPAPFLHASRLSCEAAKISRIFDFASLLFYETAGSPYDE